MKIVLASNNPGKLTELRSMLAPLGLELVAQGDLGISEAAEPFHTFVENALAKARHAAAHSGLPALADDAGLCVDAFGGLPGVATAYYAMQFGYPKGDGNNVRALLEQMQGLDNRRAALVSTLVALNAAPARFSPGPYDYCRGPAFARAGHARYCHRPWDTRTAWHSRRWQHQASHQRHRHTNQHRRPMRASRCARRRAWPWPAHSPQRC